MRPDLIPYIVQPQGWSHEKWKEYRRIVGSFDFYELDEATREEIAECLHDEASWDWYEDCDGCTAVSEPGWPSKFFPPCVRHDYDWCTGRGGWESNARFRRLNKLYRMEVWRATVRWVGVTVAWYALYKWIR